MYVHVHQECTSIDTLALTATCKHRHEFSEPPCRRCCPDHSPVPQSALRWVLGKTLPASCTGEPDWGCGPGDWLVHLPLHHSETNQHGGTCSVAKVLNINEHLNLCRNCHLIYLDFLYIARSHLTEESFLLACPVWSSHARKPINHPYAGGWQRFHMVGQ